METFHERYRLCRLFDPCQTGSVDSTEFLRLHHFVGDLQSNFRSFARNRDGHLTLSREEAKEAIVRAGVPSHAVFNLSTSLLMYNCVLSIDRPESLY